MIYPTEQSNYPILLSCQVMKDWSDLEEKYQDMRDNDPSAAENFKKQMTERFQKTVQALEEESQAEKRQLQVGMIHDRFWLRKFKGDFFLLHNYLSVYD